MAPSPDMIEATRQAAALWTHWDRDDRMGIHAVLDEVSRRCAGDDLAWQSFALAVLSLGVNLVEAARRDKDGEHLAYVLRASSVGEATGEYRP